MSNDGSNVTSIGSVPPPAALPAFLNSPTQLSTPLPQADIAAPAGVQPSLLVQQPLPVQPVLPVQPSLPVQPTLVLAPPLTGSTKTPSLPVTSQPKQPQPPVVVESSVGGEEEGSDGSSVGWVGWLKGTVSTVSTKVAQKAKTSMDSMITTLDPQMKEFLNSGGDLDLVVASDAEVKISPVREAFQQVFGKATVCGLSPGRCDDVASQPLGLESCLAAAEQRINSVRSNGSLQHPSLPVLAIENCIVELTPGSWYDVGVLLLDDPYHDVILQTFTQSTSIPSSWVEECRAGTASDYPATGSGLAVTIGSVAATKLQVGRGYWQEAWCGVSRREQLQLAARSLATLYRARLPQQ